MFPLKSKHVETIAAAFAQFIGAFLPPKIMQCDNGKEFKGALLILLRKYGIQIVNGAPRSPQTQGLVDQANGVVEVKVRAWKMDNESTEWVDGLLEVTLAINTQKHSTIGCAPAELLFRERTSYIDWLNSQKRKDITIGVSQEDPTQTPIFALSPSPSSSQSSRIDIGICSSNSRITMRISPELASSEINLHISPSAHSSQIEEWFDTDVFDSGVELEAESEVQPIAIQLGDPVIEKAQKSIQKARIRMVERYSKKHDIQYFEIGDIVSLKVPREDRTATDNRRLFGRIFAEPYPHRYKILTLSGLIKRPIPTKKLGIVEKALWPDTIIPDSVNEVTVHG